MNIARNLEQSERLYADCPALIFEGRTYCYREINELANRVANLLADLGIREGDRVALFLPNIPEFLFAYYGILKLGAIVVSISARLKAREVQFILDDSGALVVITSDELMATLPQRLVQHILVTGRPADDHYRRFDDLLADSSPIRTSVDLSPNTPAAILYTSGTTGTPKGAVLSHNNVISNVQAACHHCGIVQRDRLLLFVPLFHCFGQNAIMNCSVASGATIVLQQRFGLDEILQSIQENHVSHFYGVPTVFIWLSNADLTDFDLSSIRYYFSAAAKLPVEIAEQWRERFGLPIYEGYGLTETSPFSSYNHGSDYRIGSIGTPIKHVTMQIWDEQEHVLGPGQLGEIVIKGPNIMLGYWNRPVETADAMSGDWFHSGDIGFCDEDGYFYITDRLKDMINVSGLKVYPAEVENVLYQHPAVQEAAVYGVPHAEKGEVVWATVVLKAGWQTKADEPLAEELIGFCEARVATFKAPCLIQIADAIPKNPTGKVLKRVLIAAAQAKQE
ncbi:MAG: long-chain fatty acid--CoA ligase [Caldilineaceae bacterium]